jgi:toxin FitB
MNVVDSSGWLEYFADAPNANFFASPIEDTEQLIVPAISLYEVFKRICQQKDESEALQAVAVMMQSQVVDLTPAIALGAAKISLDLKLPMADSIILATAQANNAVHWTQDGHFEDIEGVKFVAKQTESD